MASVVKKLPPRDLNRPIRKKKTSQTFVEAADSLRNSMMFEAADNIDQCINNLEVIQEAIGE